MPNWCDNRITITAKNEKAVEIIKEVQDFLENKNDEIGLFSFICPSDDENQRSDWGTKWDAYRSDIVHSLNGSTLHLNMPTAWSPPIGAFEGWQKRMEASGVDLSIKMLYVESGMDFAGYWIDGDEDNRSLLELYEELVANDPTALAFAKKVDIDVEYLAEAFFCSIRMDVESDCDCALCRLYADKP